MENDVSFEEPVVIKDTADNNDSNDDKINHL